MGRAEARGTLPPSSHVRRRGVVPHLVSWTRVGDVIGWPQAPIVVVGFRALSFMPGQTVSKETGSALGGVQHPPGWPPARRAGDPQWPRALQASLRRV